MAKLEENKIKAEEELQGYTTAEADADVFTLGEGDTYPGEIPDFGFPMENAEVMGSEKYEAIAEEEPEAISDEQQESVTEEPLEAISDEQAELVHSEELVEEVSDNPPGKAQSPKVDDEYFSDRYQGINPKEEVGSTKHKISKPEEESTSIWDDEFEEEAIAEGENEIASSEGVVIDDETRAAIKEDVDIEDIDVEEMPIKTEPQEEPILDEEDELQTAPIPAFGEAPESEMESEMEMAIREEMELLVDEESQAPIIEDIKKDIQEEEEIQAPVVETPEEAGVAEASADPEIPEEEKSELASFISSQKEKAEQKKSEMEPEIEEKIDETEVFEKKEPAEAAVTTEMEISGESESETIEEKKPAEKPAEEIKAPVVEEPKSESKDDSATVDKEIHKASTSNTIENKTKKGKSGILGWLIAACLFLILGAFVVSVILTDNSDKAMDLFYSIVGMDKEDDKPLELAETITITTDTIISEETIATDTTAILDSVVSDTMQDTKPAEKEVNLVESTPKKVITQKKTYSSSKTPNATKEKKGVIKRVYYPIEEKEKIKEEKKEKKEKKEETIIKPSANKPMIVKADVDNDVSENKKVKDETMMSEEKTEKPVIPSLDKHKGTFHVQVYSTLSKNDAKKKVQELKRKNLKNVYISEYQKRDVTWYRVRFGEFESYEKAMQEAKKSGLSNVWIDRIK